MSDETIDANEEIDVVCGACAGDGTYETDEYSAKSGHFNRAHQCQTCKGTGTETITRYASLERESNGYYKEMRRVKRELNVAHERIVALTKQLQGLRSGGDGGAATPAVSAGAQKYEPIENFDALSHTFGV